MPKDFLENLINQLRKENISDDVLTILRNDFMMRKKKQEFMTNVMMKYPNDALVLQETLVWTQEQHRNQQQIITLIPNAVFFPYFSHPLSVALFAMSLHLPSVIVQACLLHDVIEDCSYNEQEFIAKWWKKIAGYVVSLSKVPWESHEHYLQKIIQSQLSVKQIKALDIYHNLIRALTIDHIPYLQRLLQQTEEYFLPLFTHDKKLSFLYSEVEKASHAVHIHCDYLLTK